MPTPFWGFVCWKKIPSNFGQSRNGWLFGYKKSIQVPIKGHSRLKAELGLANLHTFLVLKYLNFLGAQVGASFSQFGCTSTSSCMGAQMDVQAVIGTQQCAQVAFFETAAAAPRTLTTLFTSPSSPARLPRMAKTTTPAKTEVRELQTEIRMASLAVRRTVSRAGHLRYFLILSIIKNDFLHFPSS